MRRSARSAPSRRDRSERRAPRALARAGGSSRRISWSACSWRPGRQPAPHSDDAGRELHASCRNGIIRVERPSLERTRSAQVAPWSSTTCRANGSPGRAAATTPIARARAEHRRATWCHGSPGALCLHLRACVRGRRVTRHRAARRGPSISRPRRMACYIARATTTGSPRAMLARRALADRKTCRPSPSPPRGRS